MALVFVRVRPWSGVCSGGFLREDVLLLPQGFLILTQGLFALFFFSLWSRPVALLCDAMIVLASSPLHWCSPGLTLALPFWFPSLMCRNSTTNHKLSACKPFALVWFFFFFFFFALCLGHTNQATSATNTAMAWGTTRAPCTQPVLVLQPESLYPSLFGIPMLGEAFEFQGLAAAAAASGWLGPGSLAIMAAAPSAADRII